METLITSILSFVAPVIVKGANAAVSRWIAPDHLKPSTVEEYVAMQNSDISKLQAIAQLEGAGATYPWVEAIRKLMRPVVVVMAIIIFGIAHLTSIPVEKVFYVDQLVNMCIFYLFGERTIAK